MTGRGSKLYEADFREVVQSYVLHGQHLQPLRHGGIKQAVVETGTYRAHSYGLSPPAPRVVLGALRRRTRTDIVAFSSTLRPCR